MVTQPLHERLMAAVAVERQRGWSRRSLITTSAKIAGGGALAMAFAGSTANPILRQTLAQEQVTFESDVDVLNYALTLEHLETAFYRDGLAALGEGSFTTGPFGESVFGNLTDAGIHEATHVEVLTEVIASLGGQPVQEAVYDFGDAFLDPQAFIATAQAVENLGVSAYNGAGQFLTNPDLVTAAGTIVANEARHAAYLNLLVGIIPFPDAFETPLPPEEVLAVAGPFIVG